MSAHPSPVPEPTGASGDPGARGAFLSGLSDPALLDLLREVRGRASASRLGPAGYEAALAALEAEVAGRGLALEGGEPERRPLPVARRKLAALLRDGAAEELAALIPDLDPRGLWAIFRRAVSRFEPAERYALTAVLFARLDQLHYDPPVAHRRRQRYLDVDLPLERKLERVEKAVAFEFARRYGLGD